MADSGSSTPPDETPNQRQARLRREKRNAKIQSTGNDRLAKITQLSGRKAPAPEDGMTRPTATASITNTDQVPATTEQPTSVQPPADDPAEIDISEHHWTPQSRQQPPQGPPGVDGNGDQNADPMMQMMQQMMGGQMPAGLGDPSNPNDPMKDLPPFMRAMMQGQQKADAQASTAAAKPKSNSAYLWRIVHAIAALTLALYIATTSTFNGTKLSRAQSSAVDGSGVTPRLFYMFATTELVLQSSRFFLERGQLQGAGMLATVANSGLVPEPFAGYVRILGRYSVIWQTIVGDAMTVVFVLGALAWWKGMAVA